MKAFPKAVVIVAGGVGSRMGASIPKQFLTIKDKPIIAYTIEQFIQFDAQIEIVVVCHKNYIETLYKISQQYFLKASITVIEGGNSRFQSCKIGVEAIETEENKIVAIHDAVRPNVSQALIKNGFQLAYEKGAEIPAIKLTDTIRVVYEDGQSDWMDRNQFRKMQTPQCFSLAKLKAAYTIAATQTESNFTDDASVWEANGQSIYLYEGEEKNIKITSPTDLVLMEFFLTIKD